MEMCTTKKYADDFLQSHPQINAYPFTNQKIFNYAKKLQKDFFELTDREFVDFFFDYAGINSVATLDCYRTSYLRFYDWCIENGYTNCRNIFRESVFLDSDTLADYMAKKCPLYYFSEEDVAFLSENATECPIISEVLVRCFYEGISSYDELIHLRKDQIDLTERLILLEQRQIGISERLTELLQKLMLGEVDIADGRNGYRLRRFKEEDVFVYRIAKDTDTNRKQFLKRRLEHVGKQADISVTSKRLYQSGLLHTIRSECENDDEVLHLLYEDKNKKTNAALDEILTKHGYPLKSNRVRYMFKPYMIQLIASHEE